MCGCMEEYSDAVVVRRIVSLVVLISICAHSAESVVLARADAAEAHVGTDATACLDVRRVEARGDVCPSDMMERLGPAFPFVHLQADSHRRVRLAQALPRCFSAIYNAAAAMQGSLQLQASSELWSRALRVWEGPDGEEVGSQALAEGWYHAAVVKHSLGHDSDAIDAALRSITLEPAAPRAWFRLGLILHGVPAGGASWAIRALLAALRLMRPGLRVGREQQRVGRDGKDVATSPGRGGDGEVLYYILQETLREAGQAEWALQVARQGVRQYPESAELLCRMFVVAVQVCDWRGWPAFTHQLQSFLGYGDGEDGGGGQLFGRVRNLNCITAWDSLYMPVSAEAVKRIAQGHAHDLERLLGTEGVLHRQEFRRRWLDAMKGGDAQGIGGAWLMPLPASLSGQSAGPRARGLKVGYLSSHLNHWALGRDMLHVLRLHRRQRVESVCMSLSRAEKGPAVVWQRQIREACDTWVDVSRLADAALAREINSHSVHVLVNLNGWITGHRNAATALRPAPVQIIFKDFPGTFGGGAGIISHVLSDRVVTPPDLECLYAEALVLVPPSYHANAHSFLHAPFVGRVEDGGNKQRLREELTAWGIPRHGTLLCNFNSLYKIDPVTFDSWLQVLLRCNGPEVGRRDGRAETDLCYLWLLKWSRLAVDNLRRYVRASARYAHLESFLIFTELLPESDHVRLKGGADLFLDTPRYNAHGTMADNIWARVPVVSLPQQTLASRVTASLLTAAGTAGACLVRTHSDYVAVAGRAVRGEVGVAWRRHISSHLVPAAPRWGAAAVEWAGAVVGRSVRGVEDRGGHAQSGGGRAKAEEGAQGQKAMGNDRGPQGKNEAFDLSRTVESLEVAYALLWEECLHRETAGKEFQRVGEGEAQLEGGGAAHIVVTLPSVHV